jgi:hypothetical protein
MDKSSVIPYNFPALQINGQLLLELIANLVWSGGSVN